MLRIYCKLYFCFFLVNIKSVLAYEKDFILGIIAMVLKNLINLLILIYIFSFVETLDGWDFDQILFFYGFATTGYALWHCFFINTLSLSYYIRQGHLDRFLLRPLNPLFQIMTDTFDEDGWGELVLGIAILLMSIIRLKIESLYLLLLPLLLAGTSLIYAGIALLGSTVCFFTIANTSLSGFVMDLQNFAKYPLSIYNKFIRVLFSTLIPIGFCAFFPGLPFLDDSLGVARLLIISPLFSLFWFGLVCLIWFQALKRYTSSGS